jgi:threonine aldolase
MAWTGSPRLDFRSDTRTVPDARMREAMAAAEVGDDVYGDDPTVALLEERVAELLGTEAALLTPTGTMANLLAPLAATGPRGTPAPRVIAGADTHMAFLEADGLRRFGGVELLPVAQRPDGLPDPDALAALLAAGADTPTVVCVENTGMMRGGNALDAEATRAVAASAHRHGAHLHLDGARLANAAVALAVPPAELAGPADSVAFCVSKGLGAPAGGLLCGSRAYVARARELRGWLGGSLHQAGVVAAPALVALGRLPDLAADHERAAALASGLASVPGVELMRPPRPTNMVMARLAGLAADECAVRLAGHGVGVLPLPNGYVRFVIHRAHDMIGVREAVGALAAVAAAAAEARPVSDEDQPDGNSPRHERRKHDNEGRGTRT